MKQRAGFTLVEVLVAVTVTSLLLTTIYGVFTTTSEAKERVEQRAAAVHLGRVLFTRIGRELIGLNLADAPQQPVLSGGKNDKDEPFLEILSNAGEGPDIGRVRIRYRLVAGEDEDAGLWRDSGAAYLPVDELLEQRLSGEISRFALRFHNGSSWNDSWDSASDGIPRLVEVRLELKIGEERLPLHTIFQPPRNGVL